MIVTVTKFPNKTVRSKIRRNVMWNVYTHMESTLEYNKKFYDILYIDSINDQRLVVSEYIRDDIDE